MLFQRFDRLLFLQSGGRTVYFGPVGENSNVLASYFERNGAKKLPEGVNPAEWMLEVIGAAPGSTTDIDWHQTWRDSKEMKEVHDHIAELARERPKETKPASDPNSKADFREFAAPFTTQFWEVTIRIFEQYWRTPSYIYSKLALTSLVGLFIGFSFFREVNTQQGLQNQMFGIFMLFTIFGQLVQQIMPLFVTQRSLYESRERPSKTYSWKVFMLSNIVVELPWSTLCAVLIYFTWYYPIGLYNNAAETNSVAIRGFQEFLFIWQFLLFSATFAFFAIAAIDTAETGGNIANLAFSLTLIFCGVLVQPDSLPRFWIFMYRVSPFTYLVEGMLTTAVADASAACSDTELLRFPSPANETCAQYLATYQQLTYNSGYLQPGTEDSHDCSFCQFQSTNSFLQGIQVNYANSWRDFGIMWAFIIFNVFGAVALYYLVRVPKGGKKQKTEQAAPAPVEEKTGVPDESS